jgi:hypothetical protein
MTTRSARYARASRIGGLTSILIGAVALAGGLAADSGQGWAKHRKAAPAPVENPADPCAALRTYIQKHIVELKKLKTELEAEQNGAPKSIAAALDRLEGKPTVDAEKNEKIATTRKEADSVNSLLHAQGCAAINIDKELAKP